MLHLNARTDSKGAGRLVIGEAPVQHRSQTGFRKVPYARNIGTEHLRACAASDAEPAFDNVFDRFNLSHLLH
jgi:hypothetical protein